MTLRRSRSVWASARSRASAADASRRWRSINEAERRIEVGFTKPWPHKEEEEEEQEEEEGGHRDGRLEAIAIS